MSKPQAGKVFEELKRRVNKQAFTPEDHCFDKQLAFINDKAKFKTAVCSRRCLAKGTLVLTENGPMPIEDVKVGDYVYSEHGIPIRVKATFYNGKKEVIELLHNRRVVAKATKDHVFLVHDTYADNTTEQRIEDFHTRHKIVRVEIDRAHGKPMEAAYSLGALLGDGCSRQGSVNRLHISSKDSLVPQKVAKELGGTVLTKYAGNYTWNIATQVRPQFYQEWCANKYAHEKTCDIQEVMSWNRKSRLQFFAGLLDTDGSVQNGRDGLVIKISMQAKAVVEAAQLLFLDLWGYKPSIRIDNRPKYKNGPVYEMALKHNYFAVKALKELDQYLVTPHKKFKEEYNSKLVNNFNPAHVGIKLGSTSIEDTYDIHVDSPTNLYLIENGLVTHNSGKSVACAIDLLYTALNMKGDVAYITLNRRSAKRIIWRTLLELIEKYDIPCKLDNTELTITLENKNVIHISGAKDEADIEKLRGLSFRKIYIDECQSFRSYLETLIDDILEPALTDYDGSLILIGTPGPVLAGYFYEASQSKGWSHHHWTLHDNPWILSKSGKTAEQIIEERCIRRGISKDDPSILREYYGKWVKDYDSLVFKFDKQKNIDMNRPDDLSFVFGIDIGWIDADAIAVMGYSPSEKNVYLVEEIITNKQTISSLAEQIRELEHKYKPVKMVMDAGALGKKIQEEIRQRHQIQVHAAEKTRKLEFIELLNDDLRTARFKTFPESRFEQDSYLVQWDREVPGKPKISDTYHTDIGDSVLYAWRECRHFLYEKPKEVLVRGTDRYMDHLEEQEATKLMEELKKKQSENQELEGWIDDIDPYED